MNNDTKKCPYCGQKIKVIAQKCRFCGKWLNEDENKNKQTVQPEKIKEKIEEKFEQKQNVKDNIKSDIKQKEKVKDSFEKQVDIFNICLLLFMFLPAIIFILIRPLLHETPFNRNVEQKIEISDSIKNKNLSAILNQIDSYQTRYWAIIARNDVFFTQNNNVVENDGGDLSDLFNEVAGKIKINQYLQKLSKEETEYNKKSSKFFKLGNIFKFTRSTRITLNQFNPNKDISKLVLIDKQFYEELNNLLNELYQKIETSLNPNDLQQLKQSQNKWLSDVQKYKELSSANINGNASEEHNYWFFVNTTWEFRILLLMLYLS